MKHEMILSASGWRKVFAKDLNEESSTTEIGSTNEYLCALIGESWAQFLISYSGKKNPVCAVGIDTRPTGPKIAEAVLKALVHFGIKIQYLGISSAPEIMAYSKKLDGFLYISASHNPIGHNGIKFGLNDGGVIDGSMAKKLAENFVSKCEASNSQEHAQMILSDHQKEILKIKKESPKFKQKALSAYENFISLVITGTDSKKEQEKIFSTIKNQLENQKLSIVCDMNGSSRALSIDSNYLRNKNIDFLQFNEIPGRIAHAIIPEPENLIYCAQTIESLHKSGKNTALLGYMPDCDGDRGNVVYWNEKDQKAVPIKAQEVFALCVMSELAFETWKNKSKKTKKQKKLAVAVNCPTSMRIDEICQAFDAKLFRAEVGEANVVHLAREKRQLGYNVRILGEGSNGGNITNPSSVRDPLATIFALIKLLTIKDTLNEKGEIEKGLYHLWLEKSSQEELYKSDFTISDILESLPKYITTGVSEKRAIMKVKTEDKGKLKLRFQRLFEQEWNERKEELEQKYHITSWTCCTTNGTTEIENAKDWNNGNGGLKIKFFNKDKIPVAFIWMRPSGTEPVFRVMCDVKGDKPKREKSLLEWESSILQKADSIN